jgi:ankyrin repeat protein
VAAAKGDIEIVQALLAKGADPHIKGKDGRFPLVVAAANGHTETVEIILAEMLKKACAK